MKKQIYKNYTIKQRKEVVGGGFMTMITYDVFKEKTHICHVLTVAQGKEKIDQLTNGVIQ